MKFPTIGKIQIPLLIALPTTGLAAISVAFVEWSSLDSLDHPGPVKVNCISCHSDKKTLAAMADKAGDPLYLVHSGQLTERELHQLNASRSSPFAPKGP